jgi:hypothetical protein
MTTPIAVSHSDGCRGRCDAVASAWAGRGFSRPGPGAEVPQDLYRAALQDALAFTIDRDGRGECDGAARQALHLCEADQARHASPRSDRAFIPGKQRSSSPATTKAALRAVGVPPLAAALRKRLRLTPEQDAER